MYEVIKTLECEGCGRVIKTLTEYENQQVANNPHNYIIDCDDCSKGRSLPKKKYAIHPGWVTSLRDGDQHFIGAGTLAHLYRLHSDEWIRWAIDDDKKGRDPDEYIHLYPRFDGNYGRPTEELDR